jgi:hypothetical protein
MKHRVLWGLGVAPGLASRTIRLVPRVGGLAGRKTKALGRETDKEKPPRRNPGGQREPNRWTSVCDRIAALPTLGLGGLDCQAHLLAQGAGQGRWGQMLGHGAKFGHKKEQAIAALLFHKNVEAAARAVGISANTLQRWTKDPEFEAAYREARRAAFCQSIARLQDASGAAVATVLKIMLDSKVSAGTRLRAAEVVLAKAMEIEDIESSVSELERAGSAQRSRNRTAIITGSNTKALPDPATTPAQISTVLRQLAAPKQR